MVGRFYGAVIRTRRLDAMRQFLSETVGLGEPVVNSNFWLEYEVSPGAAILAVESDPVATVGDDDRGNVVWCLGVDNLAAFEQRMAERGFGAEAETDIPITPKALVFRDPDGNRFLAIATS